MPERKIGAVQHYFNNAGVAAMKLDRGVLKVGDVIHVKGHTTDFVQRVKSLQMDHYVIEEAIQGDDVGIKVNRKVREHDSIFKVIKAS